jgi:hypothetical protein
MNTICHENVNLGANHVLAGRTFSTSTLAAHAENDFELYKFLFCRHKASPGDSGPKILTDLSTRRPGRRIAPRDIDWRANH